jgi:hypothetical protein
MVIPFNSSLNFPITSLFLSEYNGGLSDNQMYQNSGNFFYKFIEINLFNLIHETIRISIKKFYVLIKFFFYYIVMEVVHY